MRDIVYQIREFKTALGSDGIVVRDENSTELAEELENTFTELSGNVPGK